MHKPFTPQEFQTVTRVVEGRRTFKVMGDVGSPVQIDLPLAQPHRDVVLRAVKSADAAPFHYDRHCDNVAQPWRVNILWHESCQKIAANFHQWLDDVKPGNKLPSMLSACGACVLVSWLPQFDGEIDDANAPSKSKQLQIDREHLAAASAYVQNLMLLLTAANMGTYWSSGGQFRERPLMDRLQIDTRQQLLAAVFVEFPETNLGDVQRVPGKLAEKRSDVEAWMNVIQL